MSTPSATWFSEATIPSPSAISRAAQCARYGTRLNFTLASLASAQRGLQRLRQLAADDRGSVDSEVVDSLRQKIREALEDNLDVPRALALTWEFARREGLSGATRRAGLLGADSWLGLGLELDPLAAPEPGEWRELAAVREQERREAHFAEADTARLGLLDLGVVPEDGRAGTDYRAAVALDLRQGLISSPTEIPDQRNEPDLLDVSVSIVSNGYPGDLERCIRSLQRHRGAHRVEILAVDNDAPGVGGEARWPGPRGPLHPRLPLRSSIGRGGRSQRHHAGRPGHGGACHRHRG